MKSLPTFLAPPLPTARPSTFRHPPPLCTTSASASASAPTPTPDAGLIAAPGVTGTCCANLWPLPLLGRYGWFLNVYDRSVAADVGPFVVRAGPSPHSPLTLEFAPPVVPPPANPAHPHAAFNGIAAGNANVADNRAHLAPEQTPYTLKFFEKGGSEPFWNRRNEIHIHPPPDPLPTLPDAWTDPAPTFRVVSRASTYEVRRLYSGAGSAPRNASKFEYFAMNLFPIFPLAKYSCFVCVWHQRNPTAPVAIDKSHDGKIHLSFFDPLELPPDNTDIDLDDEMPHALASFAVKVFFGPVTDTIVASQHKILLSAILASPTTRPVSDTAFRIVVDNKPAVLTPNRRNEIWVQVE